MFFGLKVQLHTLHLLPLLDLGKLVEVILELFQFLEGTSNPKVIPDIKKLEK